MPGLAYASCFLWVMVVGLLGPSVPAIIKNFDISYTQVGFFFTLLSVGSLVGTSLGAAASDFVPRKLLYGSSMAALCLGLITIGLAPTYVLLAAIVLVMSLVGSPIQGIGQSIMLDMFPDRRVRYLSFLASFAGAGSVVAPLLISVNYSISLNWRWPFIETGILCFLLFLFVVSSPLPQARVAARRESILDVLRNRHVAFCAALIFFSAAIHLGFAFWVSQYFAFELGVSPRLASIVVGIYLAGVVTGRLIVPPLVRNLRLESILIIGLSISVASIVAFILIPSIPFKVALCAVYGLGVGPVYPLVMAYGVIFHLHSPTPFS